MRIRVLLLLLLLLPLAAQILRAEEDGADLRKRPRALDPVEHGVGTLLPDLSFVDVEGKSGRLSDFKGSKALVLAFTNVGCPVCKRYGPRLGRLEKTWRRRGVAFLFVNPSPQDGADEIAATRKTHGMAGRYVHDVDRSITQALGVTTTAEVFVLDAARTLVYRGAVDDQYGVGYVLEKPTVSYLASALEAVLARRSPETQATTAPGCVLDLEPAKTPVNPKITWHEHVSRIVQRRCQSCHRAGESAPFTLSSYAEAKGNAGMIRWVVEQRVMPPWFAGEKSLACGNDAALSGSERSQVLEWVDAGCPPGDERDAPLARTWPQGWRIGEPDAVIEIPRPFEVPAEGVVDYQYMDVATNYPEDRWVQAFEIRPTAPQVVHHVLVFVKYPRDHPRRGEQPRVRGGVAGYFAAMVPGQGGTTFPAGTARFLPKGARLRFQLHYTTNGRAATDRTRLGFIFAKEKPQHEMRSMGVYNVGIRIPPGAKNHKQVANRLIPVAGRVYGFTPHMHLRGKAFRYEAAYPDGKRQILLDIPRYDFNWQLSYLLAEPLDVPAGTRIHATAWYDNSADNPANPDPTTLVRWGEQTWDEMLIGYVDWHPVSEAK